MKTVYNDDDLMPFGKYKGVALANVPGDYLIWLYNKGLEKGALKNYIIENMDLLQKEK